jgi:nicotinamide-nucleotide amidase
MKAHIISIGDELLIGQTINTNAAFIGEQLTDNQVFVSKVSVIGDDEDAILTEFTEALKSADIVLVTGGLGPTHDDITREAVCKFFNCGAVHNADVFEDVKNRFQSINRPLTKVNEAQALIPEVAVPIRNRVGTAPGYWIEKDGKIMTVMPGVPHEMKAMVTGYIIPRVRELTKNAPSFMVKVSLLTTGIAESALFEKLGNLDDLLQGAKLAFLPSTAGVKMRVTVTAETRETAEGKLTEIEQKIRAIAGRFIYGKNEDDLAEVVGRLLKERSLTLAVAESCTGGNISNRITNYSGSSEYFERGVISYSNASKVEILNVSDETLEEYGAVSEEVAKELANGIRAISGSDIGLAITGIMGPTGGSEEKPVGTAFIGLSTATLVKAVRVKFGDDRILNKERASQAALALLRKLILGIPLDA